MEQPQSFKNLFMPKSSLSTLGNKTGSWRFLRPSYDEKTAPCSTGCPAGEDIPRIEMLTTQGLFKEAWEKILIENPLPSVCGRVCFHTCESNCNRREFDSAIAIHTLERFIADTAVRYGISPELPESISRKQKIAVIGAGPAGLAASWFLSLLGYSCEIFEAAREPGGILRYGIPLYRLPHSALAHDVRQITERGVSIHTNERISTKALNSLKKKYDAVFISCGYGKGMPLDIKGEDMPCVMDGLEFLRQIGTGTPPDCSGVSAVIGGGNTAVDVARSIVRLRGKALLIYRRRRRDMPAFAGETEMALGEGVELHELLTPTGIAQKDGDILLTLQEMKVEREEEGRAIVAAAKGKSRQIRVNRIIKAIGAGPAESWQLHDKTGKGTLPLSHSFFACNSPGAVMIWGGDLVNSTKSVVHAVASGKQAAIALDILFREGMDAVIPGLQSCFVGPGPVLSLEAYLGGERKLRNHHTVKYEEINTDYFRFSPRLTQPRLLKEERIHTFEEIDLKISAHTAMKEAERCFNCGLCNQCDNCFIFCPETSVLLDRDHEKRHIDYDYCKGCGLCVVECPRNAMTLREEKG